MTDAYCAKYSRGVPVVLAAYHLDTKQAFWLPRSRRVQLMAPTISSPETSNFVRTGRSAANNARQAIKRQVSSSPEPDTPPRRSRPTPKSSVMKAASLSRTFSGNTSSDSIEFVDMLSPQLAPTSMTRPTITERERRDILANISGELVWVKVNGHGDVAGTDETETYWWPAEVRISTLCRDIPS